MTRSEQSLPPRGGVRALRRLHADGWSVSVALAIIYAGLLWYLLDHGELHGDDAGWLELSEVVLDAPSFELFFVSPATASTGAPVGTLGRFLHALSLGVHRSVESAYVGVIIATVLAHVLVIRTGRLLSCPRAGVVASLLFFAAPAFSAFYTLKAWPPAHLPLFVAATVYFLVRYAGNGRDRDIAAAALLWAGSVHLHGAAFCGLPAVLAVYARFGPDLRPTRACALLGAVLVTLSPFMHFYVAAGEPAPVVVLVGMFVGAWVVKKTLRRHRQHLLWGGLGLAAAAFVVGTVLRPDTTPLSTLLVAKNLIAGNNGFVAWRVGSHELEGWLEWPSPAAVVWLAYGVVSSARHLRLGPEALALLYCNLFPLLTFVLASFALLPGGGAPPHQWGLFLFPAPFLGIAHFALCSTDARWRRVGTATCAVLLTISVTVSVLLHRDLERHGGRNWHLATLEERRAVLEWVHEGDRSPIVSVVVDRDHAQARQVVWPWEFMNRQRRRTTQHPPVWVYIAEPQGMAIDDADLARLRSSPDVGRHEIGAVEIYSSPRPIDVGVALP